MQHASRLIVLFGVLCFVAVASQALAAPKYVPGDEVARRVEKVMKGFDWSDSVEALRERAAKKNKLIFWMQIVGELDGGL